MSHEMRHLCHNFAGVKLRPDIIMTLKELSYNFFKAHIFMGIGYAIVDIIAYRRHMSCPWLFGLLTGLLFSIHIYKKGLIILVDEYKRLKSKNKDENIS